MTFVTTHIVVIVVYDGSTPALPYATIGGEIFTRHDACDEQIRSRGDRNLWHLDTLLRRLENE